MPLLKRKPVLYHPLPSLNTIIQPISSSTRDTDGPNTTPSTIAGGGTDTPPPPPTAKGKKKKVDIDSESSSAIGQGEEGSGSGSGWVAPDADNDNDQLRLLSRVFENGFTKGLGQAVIKGKKAGTVIVNGPLNWESSEPEGRGGGLEPGGRGEGQGRDSEDRVKQEEEAFNTPTDGPGIENGNANANGNGHVHAKGEMLPPALPLTTPAHAESWKITDMEVYYIPETGEIFTDYDSYLQRMNFYQQPLYQCEVSGKSSLSYFAAYANERKEIRQLHTRFPKQLKRGVLMAVQFQVEGKLETLADKIYERFQNRFFDDEKVFVDVQGDKYLARIVKTFPPRSLASSPLKSKSVEGTGIKYHTLAANLSLDPEEVLEQDDPMKYFYSAKLLVEGGDGEAFEGSVMEVQADKISRDRINFSRAMLKRFIRDCVYREAAVYSPWIVKPSVAARYAIPTEMTDQIKEEIATFREAQMDRRKREREERLGILPGEGEEEDIKDRRKKAKKEEVKVEEDVKKRPMKYPAEDFLVEYAEKDEKEGRPEVRPAPSRNLPFGDQFEKLLLCWSFLNVMGKAIGLSPFTLDEFEQSLYHKDPWTSPPPLMAEIHACLINTLIRDLRSGADPVKSLASTGITAGADGEGEGETEHENDADYWEGLKGATTETLRPIASEHASTWSTKLLPTSGNRKGWESSLVGLLWERGSLTALPTYLDHILHLTFEDKPAPTRPTWSTGPSTNTSAAGLVPSKPEKRWPTLHHCYKLDIIGWMVEMVVQTGAIRDFMEESTAALTEVRKEQIDVKREWKKIQAELVALEPKKETNGDHANGDEAEAEAEATTDVDADGDTRMSVADPSIRSSPALGTEEDELEDTPPPSDDEALSPPSSPAGAAVAGAARRQAMASKAASRAEEEAARLIRVKAERDILKAKKNETKALSAEKRRLLDEDERLRFRLRELEYEFRSHIYTLRSRPFGIDRFGNKVWWMDGIGSSAPLASGTAGEGGVTYGFGTGRIYIQGVEDDDLGELITLAEVDAGEVETRRKKEEGEGRLGPGEWGQYDTPEQLSSFISWLNPRGTRDSTLLKAFKIWLPEIQGGMHRRRIVAGLEKGAEEERRRPSRRVAGGEEEGYMGWRNKRAT